MEVAQETARLPRWTYIFDQLNDNGVKSVQPKDAQDMIRKGYVGDSYSPLNLLSSSLVSLTSSWNGAGRFGVTVES